MKDVPANEASERPGTWHIRDNIGVSGVPLLGPTGNTAARAVGRGVTVVVVVETLAGASGALSGEEPATAFLAVPGAQVWHWPTGRRSAQSSKMHAKLAVADNEVLLVSSANLTQSGISKNIEAGLLVRGGPAPARAHAGQVQVAAEPGHGTRFTVLLPRS